MGILLAEINRNGNSVVIDGNGGTVTIGNGTSGHQTVTIDGNNGTLSGLTNRTIDAPDFATKGRAATEEQLKQVADNVSDLKKNNSDFQLVGGTTPGTTRFPMTIR